MEGAAFGGLFFNTGRFNGGRRLPQDATRSPGNSWAHGRPPFQFFLPSPDTVSLSLPWRNSLSACQRPIPVPKIQILLGLSYLDANADPLLFPTRRIKGLAMSEKVAAALPVIVKPSFWKKRARQDSEKQLGLVALKA